MKRIAAISVLLLMVGLCFAQTAVVGHVYVTTTNNGTTRVLAGANVMLMPLAANVTPGGGGGMMCYRTVSGTDGSFTFPAVRAGSYQLVACARGYTQLQAVRVIVPANNTTPRITANVFMVPTNTAPVCPRNNGD